ncbi:MAG: DUF3313 domain-containing protein [Planctomycetota bacterium]|jgi:hypothetical protein
MKKCILVSVFLLWFCGCEGQKIQRTGFLSDYSKLRAQSETSFRYVPSPEKLGRYSKFIVDPVQAHFHTGSKAIEERTKGKLKEQDVRDLQNYMHKSMVEALSDRYEIVYQPGPGVARVRVALTDFKKSEVILNILPAAKVSGAGLGAATMEAEIIDSQTGEQLRALVEMQTGSRLSLDGLSKWGDAKGVMKKWAKSLRERIDEAHGN